MTDAVSLKPDLGRFGVWTFGAVKPEQAVEIEKLGYGAVWIGGSPAGDLNYVEPILEQHRDAAGRHRHRERLDSAGRRGRGGLPPHRETPTPAGSCSASASAIPSTPRSTASPTTCWSNTSTHWTPPRCRPAGGSIAALGPKVLKLAAQRSAGAHPYLTTPEHTGRRAN